MRTPKFVLVVAVLAAAVASTAAAPQHRARPKTGETVRLMATAYCDGGPTKSGVHARPGMVATDPRVLPIGSVISIRMPGSRSARTYTVTDTGAAVKGHDVDVFMPSCAEAKRFGKRPVVARIVKRGPA